jgi:hypothetical protein
MRIERSGCLFELAAMAIEHTFQRLAEVFPQVPTIGYLDGPWRAFVDSVRVIARTITRDDLYL